MKCLLLCMWTWVLLVLMGTGRSIGCLEEERNALLKIKAAFNHPYGSSLQSWSEDDGDCCLWNHVECDNITLHVTRLDLYLIRRDIISPRRPWVIDASLFLPLEELQELELTDNALSGINGTLYLKNLKKLSLGVNHLKRVPSLYKENSVEAQNLSSSQLEVNDALTDIVRITSLKAIVIRFCGLNDSKLLEGLCRLKNLEELDIYGNGFSGPLPSCLCNMTSLSVLDVQYNNFSGAIPSTLLSNLKSLEYIAFSGNAFEGSLSLASLANTSNLKVFLLLDNLYHLEVNTEEGTWFPPFQLWAFGLSNCVLNKDADSVIPSFLKEQFDLRDVQLGHNGMTGSFPNWLLRNNIHLEQFDLPGNNLSGAFHLPSNLSLVDMTWFDVSANIIEGELPSQIGSILPNLQYLNLSYNYLKGRIPPSIGNMENLETLDMSNNGFMGEISEILAKNCKLLRLLKLSGNNLQGQMLPRNSSFPGLEQLYLDSNRFTGDISPDILNSPFLEILDVSNNSISGTLPNWIGDISSLNVLMLASNLLEGPLSLSFCNLKHLTRLDLSSNNLGPNIPHCANFTVIKFLHLTNDKLTGHFPESIFGASSIVTLDLRHNALSGKLPNWIGSLQNLKVLLLQGNKFEGSIPLDLCMLKNMSILDLSKNNLFGQIPSCLKDLTFGNDEVPSYVFGTTLFILNEVDQYMYQSRFSLLNSYGGGGGYAYLEEKVNFRTKRRLELYKGHILRLMSGMDLSQNNLTGFIPLEFGYLSQLLALNLSHNHLMGQIPTTFSNLRNVESLDLSNNNLTGPIPPQLTELYTLSYFSVAHNNLSGRLPDRKYQFGTFDKESYEGNPLLCGPPLTSCDGSNQGGGITPSSIKAGEYDSWKEAFLWSFAGSYVVAFFGVVFFFYLNSHCQYLLFKLIHKLIPSLPL
ncbi:hypothetical protein BT93_G0256 [Corymbia citriodora subsp. variegata]|nr:hypothetical protein BT93_G0256 [Corymbia citriodora subsp. variegata]